MNLSNIYIFVKISIFFFFFTKDKETKNGNWKRKNYGRACVNDARCCFDGAKYAPNFLEVVFDLKRNQGRNKIDEYNS